MYFIVVLAGAAFDFMLDEYSLVLIDVSGFTWFSVRLGLVVLMLVCGFIERLLCLVPYYVCGFVFDCSSAPCLMILIDVG